MIPRHEWLRNRVKEVVFELACLESVEDWKTYQELASSLAEELQYTCTLWDKYYHD